MDTKNRVFSLVGLRVAVIILSIVTLATAAVTDIETCGSDGPKPFLDISSPTEVKPLAQGNIQDFTVQGSRMFYRNTGNQIMEQSLQDDFSKFLTISSVPLSRIMDPLSRILLVEQRGFYFDRLALVWYKTNLPEKSLPLFFSKDTFYSTVHSGSEIEVYQTQIGNSKSLRRCGLSGLTLAQGHNFPWVYAYKTHGDSNRPTLEIRRIDIRTCSVYSTLTLKNLAGPVEQVWRIEKFNGTAVKLKHSTKNLYWDDDVRHCRYYNLEDALPLVTNTQIPQFVTWSSIRGLNLIDPMKDERAPLFPSSRTLRAFTKNDIYLTDSGKTIYLSPYLENSKPLLEMKLK